MWTMKYLPKFKWNMLTEQIGESLLDDFLLGVLHGLHTAHEAAVHAAQLRVELSQSRKEQRDYLKNVELARVLGKRAERKRKNVGDGEAQDANDTVQRPQKVQRKVEDEGRAQVPPKEKRKKPKSDPNPDAEAQLSSVLGSIF